MATIDDKVVAMSFESSKFEQGVERSLSAIEKLKKALNFQHQSKSMHGIATSAKAVDLGHIAKGAEGVKAHLGAMNVAAVAIFANIAQKAVSTGVQVAKTFTIDVAKLGFAEYSTNLNSIQTILANTQAAGSNLKDVNAALDELNDYSDKTIYNFGQMARNIGTFTAAGVDLKTATASIKGIANLAALSGSNAEQASTAMYQLSQAISSGSVKLMDWNSVVNAGMGGTVFQRALATTGEHMGALKKGTVELVGPMKNVKIAGESFRNSLSAPGKDGWLTSKVLTTTLKNLTGDMTDAELRAQGWNKAQIKAIQAQAKAAQLAATNVKTIQQVLQVAKETAGSGWAKTWRIIFGDFEEAKKTFTNLSNAINGVIIDNARARNNLLGDWKALGGRTVLIDSIKIAFQNLSLILKPIKEAFRDIFPATTGKQLYELTLRFKEFAQALKPSEETVKNLKRTFRGLFAVLDIARMIVMGVFHAFGKLFGEVGKGSGGFLEVTAAIGDWLVQARNFLKQGNYIYKFFDKLGFVLSLPIKALGALKDALSGVFGGVDTGGFTEKLSPVQKILEVISTLFGKLVDQMGDFGRILEPLYNAWINMVETLAVGIVKAFTNMNFEAVLAVVRTGLFAGIFLMFKKFLGKGSLLDQIGKGFAGGILGNISSSFGSLSGSMKALQGNLVAMQQNIKAKTLKEIAIAVALLAVSVLAISLVDPKRLSSSLSAITVMFGQLLASMAILGNVSKSLGFIKMPIISASLIILAGAITALSVAVLILGSRSWEELIKGLGGVAVLLGLLVLAVGPLGASSAGLIRAGVGITALAIGLNLLALAVRQFGGMSMTELGKGLGSVAVGLGLIMTVMNKIPAKGMIAAGVGLILLATGLRILANVVQKFGEMSLATIAKGLLAVSFGLQYIGAAMQLMPKGMILQAAALLLIAVALQGIVRAVESMGGMSLEALAKGLIGLAASLTILGVAMYAMGGMLVGAASLAIAAGGITLLAGALKTMGGMSWGSILKSMIVLAAALTLIGVAGALITPVIPSLLGLGVALLLIGAGLALAGAGIALIGVGLSALVVAAPTGFGVLLQAVVQFQKGLIENVKLLILGLLEIVQALAETAPQFVDALVKILDALIDVVIQSAPKIAQAINVLLNVLVQILAANDDKLVKAGLDLIIALLKGIKNNIRQIANLVVQIIAELVRGLARNIGKIVSAGAQLLVALLRGIANGISKVATTALSIISKFLSAIGTGYARIVSAGLSILTKLLGAIASNLGKAIKAGTDVIVNFIRGVGNAGPRIITAATNAMIKFINALSKNSVKLADAGAKAIIAFLNGIATVIENRAPEMRQAGVRIGVAIVNGMTSGITSKAGEVLAKMGDLVNKVKKKAKFWESPPEAFGKRIGQELVLGLANGLSDTTKAVEAGAAMSTGVITAVKDTFQIRSPSQVMYELGREVTEGFSEGLRTGAEEDINKAFIDIRIRLTDALRGINTDIAAAKARRRELLAGKEDAEERKEIGALTAEIKSNVRARKSVLAAMQASNAGTKIERDAILKHARAYAILNDKIEKSKEIIKEFRDQYAELPEIVKETDEVIGAGTDEEKTVTRALTGAEQLALYTEKIAAQGAAIAKYNATLQQLKALGLDDATYKMLLEEGTDGQAFAEALVTAGPTAVANINKLDGDIEGASSTLGDNAAVNLYKAGEEAAKGLMAGLEAEKKNLEKLMTGLANTMVNTIKRKLKIKSPSEIFAEIGTLSMEGLARGFIDSATVVIDAVDQVVEDTLTAMGDAMSDISGVDAFNPVITPILDLTQVESKAAELAALTNVAPITAAASYGQAAAISTEQAKVLAEQAAVASGGAAVQFQQNNYSPTALTEVEIYRQTKNQLSQLKSALALT